jgi:peptide/nickel transport system substrate-binding protein
VAAAEIYFQLAEFTMTDLAVSRRHCLALGVAASSAGLASAPARAQAPRSALNLAMVAEPQTLDPMASTADLVGTIMQHVFETLYTFDAKWAVVPLLAQALPTVSKDGLQYSIALRSWPRSRPRAPTASSCS